jgi:hypothetical protein
VEKLGSVWRAKCNEKRSPRGERKPHGGIEMAKKELKKGKKLVGAKTLVATVNLRGGIV